MAEKTNRRSKGSKKTKGKGRTPQREEAMERVPSNAPTMAIAPSDYEHIFHEGPGAKHVAREKTPTRLPRLTANNQSPSPPQVARSPAVGYETQAFEVQVTPDGYNLLGQETPTAVFPKVPLPPHIVRANNQFSRAALAQVARFLASRANPPIG